ncbi:hypothetical protein [Micromonospora sp. 4G55]|uniref:hypothetical protein n=1 Tax=Micromonospora sp. 4G55 TaxID=2806102 RepID=UPI001A5A6BE2|nr:hypothetical protein [Micromonospora sp. 4G55]MBM0258962.1 hypothetical protein [Micromonospora sp. 4G55]
MTAFLDWIARRLTLWLTASGLLALISVLWVLSAWAGLDPGDAPAWAAFGVSLVGTAVAIHAARSSKASAQAGVRQAAAAEEQVTLARKSLELAEQQALTTGSPFRSDLIHKAPTSEVPYVAWWIDQRSKNTYVLRNIGTDTAREVEIDRSRIQCVIMGATGADEVAPSASTEVRLIPGYGGPKPNELWVRWEGHPEWKAVPLP